MLPEDTPDPPRLPKGHYVGNIRRYEIREGVQTKNGEATVVDFYMGISRPRPDVDATKLDGVDLGQFEFQKTFWYTPVGMAELRDFVLSFKLPRGRPYDALYPETIGREVLMNIVPGSYKSKQTGRDIPTMNVFEVVATDPEPVTDLSKQ